METQLNSYLTVIPERALIAAKVAKDAVMRGDTLGSSRGASVSIKGTENTNGIQTTLGSFIYENHVPS